MSAKFPAFTQNSRNKEDVFALFSETCLPSLIHLGKKLMSLVDNQWYPKRNARKWYCLITMKLIQDCAYMLLMMFKKSATIVMVSVVLVSTVDNDVVIIRVDTFCELKQMQYGVSLWVAFGQGTTITATTMAP